ncbi:hypothetical protein L3556_14155 [Candidatus Synechococcus calcipolaris G9]|uniref:P-type ATPase A domain-containing protein n=1 Tax=Candidatus Synechococcus calcipolaris G9 TaxID=1497997 RepID=A0ABT6F2I0_9SYNE|nr:hypothetical protein [Candidatus Synechococcus calcipolaris]MDG2992064.1 hypothetical protein [Candidatus Synechococcus calcipolaris G9]
MNYQVVHASPGRFRIHVPRLRRDRQYGQILQQLVLSLALVRQVRINRQAASLIVEYQLGLLSGATVQSKLFKCIEKAEIATPSALPPGAGGAEAKAVDVWESQIGADARLETDWERLGLPFIAVSMSLLTVPFELPAVVVGAAVLASAWPWFHRTGDHIVHKQRPSVELLDSLWIALHTVNGQFMAPAFKTGLVGTRADLRDRHTRHDLQYYPSLLLEHHSHLKIERQGDRQKIEIQDLEAGDYIWLNPGDLVPADGCIIEGIAQLTPAHLGEFATVVLCRPGDSIYAGSQVLEGAIQIQAKRTGWQTRVGLVTELIQSEPVYDTEIAKAQGEFALQAVIPVLALSVAIFGVVGAYGPAIAPMQLDFGSGIQLSLRTVMLSAQIFAAQEGIYLPTAGTLEKLAQLDTLIIDLSSPLPEPEQMKDVLEKLRQQGLKLYLLGAESGDQSLLGNLGGVEVVTTETWPQLVTYLQGCQRKVGLIQSPDSSHSVPEGWISIHINPEEIHLEAKTIVLLEPNWNLLLVAIAIARHALEMTYQNAAIICIPNLAVTTAGIFFGLHPMVNVLTNNATAFIAEFIHSDRPRFRTSLLPSVSPSPAAMAATPTTPSLDTYAYT